MATVLKSSQREFQEEPNKIDPFKIFTDVSRTQKGVKPQNLNFDLRRLEPGQYSGVYHFHRFAEELFVIVSGSATLRTTTGLEVVHSGDLLFFEMGETGAHQMFNHTMEPCIYLDIRSFIGFDVCEYPDSNKLLIAPTMEIFKQDTRTGYFEGEKDIRDKWKQIEQNEE